MITARTAVSYTHLARRQMLKVLYDVTEVPTAAAGKKKNTKSIDIPAKLLSLIHI